MSKAADWSPVSFAMAAIRPTPAKYSSTWYGSASHFGRSSHQTKSIRSTTTLVWAYGIFKIYTRPCTTHFFGLLSLPFSHTSWCKPRFFWCTHSNDTLHHQVKLSRCHCWIGTAANAYRVVCVVEASCKTHKMYIFGYCHGLPLMCIYAV